MIALEDASFRRYILNEYSIFFRKIFKEFPVSVQQLPLSLLMNDLSEIVFVLVVLTSPYFTFTNSLDCLPSFFSVF